jgi:UDP-N-acetyl-D-mannosaminuronate dehydrogenase
MENRNFMHTDVKTTLIEKLNNRTAKVAVLGMGYVGLPLATVFGEAGFSVIPASIRLQRRSSC